MMEVPLNRIQPHYSSYSHMNNHLFSHNTQSKQMTVKRIVLFGNSLAVSSVGASLQAISDMDILSVDASDPDKVSRLLDLQPDIVIFDLSAAHLDFAIALWQTNPELVLIGLDLPQGELLVLSGSREPVVNVSDLIEIIYKQRQPRAKTKPTSGQQSSF